MNLVTARGSATTAPLTDEFGLIVRPAGELNPCDLPREEVAAACQRSGAVYFQGFGASMELFEEFTNNYCSDWLLYQGGAHERQVLNPGSDKSVYSVNFYLGKKEQLKFELPLHCDMAYIKNSPAALYFYCVHPAAERGETMLCDGAAVYEQLADATRDLLRSQRINYVRKYPQDVWESRFGTADLAGIEAHCEENGLTMRIEDGTGTLVTEYKVSALPTSRWGNLPVFRNSILPVAKLEESTGSDLSIVRLEDGSPLPAEVLADIREVTARLTKLAPMAAGDFMFVDNTRVLHGRKGFADERREVAIRMAKTLDW